MYVLEMKERLSERAIRNKPKESYYNFRKRHKIKPELGNRDYYTQKLVLVQVRILGAIILNLEVLQKRS